MFSIAVICAVFVGSAVGQSVTRMFLPGIMSQALDGSVIDSVRSIAICYAKKDLEANAQVSTERVNYNLFYNLPLWYRCR